MSSLGISFKKRDGKYPVVLPNTVRVVALDTYSSSSALVIPT